MSFEIEVSAACYKLIKRLILLSVLTLTVFCIYFGDSFMTGTHNEVINKSVFFLFNEIFIQAIGHKLQHFYQVSSKFDA